MKQQKGKITLVPKKEKPMKVVDEKGIIKKLITDYWRHHQKFPKLEWIQEKSGLKNYKTVNILRELEQEGFINRKVSHYSISKEDRPEIAPPKPKAVQEVQEAKEALHKISLVELVIKAIMIFVAIGASYMSIVYTKAHFLKFHGPGTSLLFSSIVVLFLVFSFEAIFFLWGLRRYLFGVVIGLLFVIAVSFSMYTTISGQYDTIISQNKALIATLNENGNITYRYRQKLQDGAILASRREEIKLDVNRIQSQLDLFDVTEENYLAETWVIRNKLAEEEKALETIDIQITEHQNNLELFMNQYPEINFSDTQEELPPSFYVWLGGIWNMDPSIIQFITHAFPAVFIDIIAPVALAVVFFTNKPKQRRKRKSYNRDNRGAGNGKENLRNQF